MIYWHVVFILVCRVPLAETISWCTCTLFTGTSVTTRGKNISQFLFDSLPICEGKKLQEVYKIEFSEEFFFGGGLGVKAKFAEFRENVR